MVELVIDLTYLVSKVGEKILICNLVETYKDGHG